MSLPGAPATAVRAVTRQCMLSAPMAPSAPGLPRPGQAARIAVKILDRYVGRAVAAATASVLAVLLAIFAFFTFMDELEELGRGSYDLARVAAVVALRLPGLAYDLFPIAALIGALLGLGALAERNEIAVFRAAGVSRARITRAVMQAGVGFVVCAVLLGELAYPPAEREAQSLRTLAQSNRASASTLRGFWARDGRAFINIRTVRPGERFEDITLYEFDEAQRLVRASHAARARFRDGAWQLENIRETRFGAGPPVARTVRRAAWSSLLDPDIIAMVAVNPATLSALELARYVEFVERNGQSALRWQHALWTKLAYPLATGVMVYLAIPLVLGASRSHSSGRRILLGALIGLSFHVLNQAAGHLGQVLSLPAPVSALAPTVLLGAIGLLLASRSR